MSAVTSSMTLEKFWNPPQPLCAHSSSNTNIPSRGEHPIAYFDLKVVSMNYTQMCCIVEIFLQIMRALFGETPDLFLKGVPSHCVILTRNWSE